MRPTAARLALVALIVAGVAGGVSQVGTPQQGTVVGNPTIGAVATGTEVTWGDGQTLLVGVTNEGTLVEGGPERFEDRVTTARSLNVTVATDLLRDPLADRLQVRNGPVLVGRLEGGEATDVRIGVAIDRRLRPGTYQLPIRFEYDHASFVRYGEGAPEYNERSATTVVRVPVVVADRPRLTVAPVDDNEPVDAGGSGTFAFTVTNTGTEPATDVGLVVSVDAPVRIRDAAADSRRTSVYLDQLAPGESRRVRVAVAVHESAATATYLAEISAYYRTPNDFARESRTLRLGIPVAGGVAASGAADRQRFPAHNATVRRGPTGLTWDYRSSDSD